MSVDWSKARCRGADPEAYFPRNEGVNDVRRLRERCFACLIRLGCLEDALSRGEKDQHGFWGGMNVRERLALIRSRAKAAANA